MMEIKSVDFSWNNSGSNDVNRCNGQVLVDDDYWFEGVVSFKEKESYVLGGLTNTSFEFMLFADDGNSVFKFAGDRDMESAIGECSEIHEDGIQPPFGVCNFSLSSSDVSLSMEDLYKKMTERKDNFVDLGQIAYRKYYYHYCEGWYGVDVDEEELITFKAIPSDDKGIVYIKKDNWYDDYPDGMPF